MTDQTPIAAETLTLLPLDQIAEDLLPRDRVALDPVALSELENSILISGLRQPIEVCELNAPDDDGRRYGLISGMRRLTVFRRNHGSDPRFDAIPAFIRPARDIADAMAQMVAENEMRAQISPWEKGRIVMQAWLGDHFDTLDAAVDGLFRGVDRRNRTRIRAIADVVDQFDGSLDAPETLSQAKLLRLAGALRDGFGPLMEAALEQSHAKNIEDQWRLLEPIVMEAEAENRTPVEPGQPVETRPGHPRRMVKIRPRLTIRREMAAEGWTLRFTGPDATGLLMEDIMDYVELNYGREE